MEKMIAINNNAVKRRESAFQYHGFRLEKNVAMWMAKNRIGKFNNEINKEFSFSFPVLFFNPQRPRLPIKLAGKDQTEKREQKNISLSNNEYGILV